MEPNTTTEQPTQDNDQSTTNTNSPKTAFFITPLGNDNSDIRRSTEGLIQAVIRPLLKEFNIELVAPHEIDAAGSITRQVIKQILGADLVIANLTGLNPNVMYELAVRHAKRSPVIIIAHKDTILPFDLKEQRTTFYDDDMRGVVELREALRRKIPVILNDKNPENPVYDGLESLIINEQIKQQDDPFKSFMYEKLEILDELKSVFNRGNTFRSNSATFNSERSDFLQPLGSPLTRHITVYKCGFTFPLLQGNSVEFPGMISYIKDRVPGAYDVRITPEDISDTNTVMNVMFSTNTNISPEEIFAIIRSASTMLLRWTVSSTQASIN